MSEDNQEEEENVGILAYGAKKTPKAKVFSFNDPGFKFEEI